MLGYVLPDSSGDYIEDSWLRNPVLNCEGGDGCPPAGLSAADFAYLCLSQLGVWVRAALSLSAFLHSVGYVSDLRSKTQVRRIYAPPIIAGMHNNKADWDGAVRNFPDISMRTNHFPIDIYLPVSRSGHAPRPVPAAILSVPGDFFPKTFYCGAVMLMPSNIATWRKSARVVAEWLSTTTFAKAYGGVVRGMIHHVDTFLSRFGQAAGRFRRRCGVSISPLHYTTNGCLSLLLGGKR